MNSHVTASSRVGLRLPHSGVVVGVLADALRLKGRLRRDRGALYKTAQRYWDGERVEPEAVTEIVATLVDTLVPESLTMPASSGCPGAVRDLLHTLVFEALQRWDKLAGEVNALLFPVSEASDMPVPVLRLFLLDLGIRAGAWLAVRELAYGETVGVATLRACLRRNVFPLCLEGLRMRSGISVEALAAELRLSRVAVDAWRSGNSLPTDEHIEALARCTALGAERPLVASYLRLAVAADDLLRRLRGLCRKQRIDDMLAAAFLTARCTREACVTTVRDTGPSPLELRQLETWRAGNVERTRLMLADLWRVVALGVRSELGTALAQHLAGVASLRNGVRDDFAALPGTWVDRVCYWMERLGAAPHRRNYLMDHAERTGEFDPASVDGLHAAVLERELRMSGFDWHSTEEAAWVRVPASPQEKAMNRVRQADESASISDLPAAVEHMRHAVRHDATNASLHFRLGAFLWQEGEKALNLELVEEGLLECRLAVQLDPEFGNARNEIAVILSNLRRHEEAEAAYADAEPHHGNHAHHWFGRGQNYVALGRYEDARTSFEKAIARTKDGAHVEAKTRLAATLMALGETAEGRRLGRRVHHLTGVDPSDGWEAFLDAWNDRPHAG